MFNSGIYILSGDCQFEENSFTIYVTESKIDYIKTGDKVTFNLVDELPDWANEQLWCMKCHAYVYLWKRHPLAQEKEISLQQLEPFPCLSFEQGEQSSFYFAEEILRENEYPRMIKACDRATMLNLMVGLNGYTLCSGIISEDLNGDDFVVVPFKGDDINQNSVMKIGYITKKDSILSQIGEIYIAEVKKYLAQIQREEQSYADTN